MASSLQTLAARAASLLALCVALGPLAACPPAVTCESDGEPVAVGETFIAPDGCNQCVCGADGTATCTLLACPDAGGPSDGGPGADGGPDEEPNEVVPIPALLCDGGGTEPVLPLAPVTVSAASYEPATAGAAVTSIEWSLMRAPVGSRAQLDQASGTTTTLRSLVQGINGVDVVGAYVLRATLTDDTGAEATYDCALQVRPPAGLYVELVWDAPHGDLDLRLMKRDSEERFCVSDGAASGPLSVTGCSPPTDALDCFYANCKADSGGPRPDWDGDAQSSLGDPELLVDVLAGFGPEAIRVPQPVDGDYLVGVFAFQANSGPYEAMLRVYNEGQLRLSSSFSMAHQAWQEVALVTVQGGADLCVKDLVTDEERCAPAPQCTPAATCAQCASDADCGPGSRCDDSSSQCVADVPVCGSDEDCQSPRSCSHVTDVCAASFGCTSDADCPFDQSCDLATGLCRGGGPVVDCNEDVDEPNDTPETAVVVSGDSYEGFLCTEDVDYISFPMVAGSKVTVTAIPTQGFPPLVGTLSDGEGNVLAASTLLAEGVAPGPAEETTLTLVGRTGASPTGPLLLELRAHPFEPPDVGRYEVTVTSELADPLDCAAEVTSGVEPNDVAADAHPLPIDAPFSTLRCGFGDRDHFSIAPPPLKSLLVEIDFEGSEGDLDARLVATTAIGNLTRVNSNRVRPILWSLPEGVSAAALEVYLAPGVNASLDQEYTVTVTTVDRPAACDGDVGEPDGHVDTAQPLAPGAPVSALRCTAFDVDVYAVTVPAAAALEVEATFVHGAGDLRLDLLDEAGAFTGTFANTSTVADGTETLALPVDEAATVTRYVRVRLHGSGGTEGQPYTVLARAVQEPVDGGVDDGGADDGGDEEDGGTEGDAG